MNLGLFWPNVIDETSAMEAAKQGWYVALFSGAITIFSIIVGWTSVWSFIDVVLICVAGYGCLKMSRVAAIFGLLLCVFNIYDKYTTSHTFGIMPVFVLFFVNAIRGTFKYSEIKKSNAKKLEA